MNVWNLTLYSRSGLEQALRLVKARASQPDACDRLAAWLRPQLEKKLLPSKMTQKALIRWLLNFEAVQSRVFDEWHDELVLEFARRGRMGKVTSKQAFCPFCGGTLEVLFAGKSCIGGCCDATGARMPTGPAEAFGNQLGRKGGTDKGLCARTTRFFCAGCGKKLRFRASRTDRGWFSISTRCACGHLVNGHTLSDLAKAMERRHERGALQPEAPERPDPARLDLLGLARRADIETLLKISDGNADSNNDAIAYKWLCVAADFGHRKAEGAIDDLLETSSLRTDDGLLVAEVHRELASAYARGKDGLPRDAAKAAKHSRAAR